MQWLWVTRPFCGGRLEQIKKIIESKNRLKCRRDVASDNARSRQLEDVGTRRVEAEDEMAVWIWPTKL